MLVDYVNTVGPYIGIHLAIYLAISQIENQAYDHMHWTLACLGVVSFLFYIL